jgi:Na+/melibiose symporter-like transporter
MTVLMFFFLFPAMATEAIPDGRFNRESYAIMGIVGSALMLVSILVCAMGTHSRIPYLMAPPPQRRMTLSTIFKEIFETLSNRSFIALFIASVFSAVASGLAAGLAFYFQTYFWGFTSIEQGVINMSTFIAAAIGFVLAPLATRHLGKKRGAMIIGLIAFLGAPLPVVLRLFGVLPENGTDFIFWRIAYRAQV